MREDLKEQLEKHYTGGLYLFGVLPNRTIDIMVYNPNNTDGLEVIHRFVTELQKLNPDLDKWIGKEQTEKPPESN